jgi:glucose/arabinose dehydrogenase
MRWPVLGCACSLLLLAACAAGPPGAAGAAGAAAPAANESARAAGCSGPSNPASRGIEPAAPPGLTVPGGFRIRTIAQVGGARELAALPNGDLLVGTAGDRVYIVPDAEAANGRPAGAPSVFATLDNGPAAGVAFAPDRCEIFFATNDGVWATRYRGGDLTAERVRRIARVRTGPVAPRSDGDVHVTTSVAYANGIVYASVGSSCNRCTEVDPTRASILQMKPDGSEFAKRATRIRNGIALFTDPATGALWVGGAGQDKLPFRHPYEFLDDVSSHAGIADYGWPECEENHRAYTAGADCSATVQPLVELFAYSTIVGAAFYPAGQTGPYAFPSAYRGGIFAAAHGSWHTTPNGDSAAPSQVVFIPMNGDAPKTPVDWAAPTKQWTTFVGGLQEAGQNRRGRPTGVAIGAKGSLFVADDQSGLVYRIRR